MDTKQLEVEPERLLLDPNNYRFHDLSSYKPVSNPSRYAETGVQARALQLLQTTASFELGSLRDSILSNGFVPLEQIVVEHFDGDGTTDRFLVLEGNRRVAAVKTLLEDHEGGAVDIGDRVMGTMTKLPVIVVTGSSEERRSYKQTLMAIRHVSGIREWGPYQQAKLVVELYENEEESFGAVAQRIGISSREVARRYRASKALQQMEEDDEFGEYALPKLYSFFHEAVSQPKVREWLDFSDETFSAKNADSRRAFYELLSPRTSDGEMLPPKLQNANRQVRQLKNIVGKSEPMRLLLDPERSFEDAVKAAEDETVYDVSGVLERQIGVALHALRQPGIDAWLSPSDKAGELWAEFVTLVDRVRDTMKSSDSKEAS